MLVKHNISPIYNKYSKILILGSMPSIVSRKENFYYAHKQNRFWKILSIIFKVDFNSIEDKIDFLIDYKIALFDIIKECEIEGSNDSSISNVIVNDIEFIIKNSNIKYILCTGKTSFNLYNKFFNHLNLECYFLPSPSSANATYDLKRLVNEYSIIKNLLAK